MEQTRVPRNNPIIIQKLYNKKKAVLKKKKAVFQQLGKE